MDIVDLARFQFAMTTVFHFFFVPFSIGTAFVVAILETFYVRTKNEAYKKLAKFWGKYLPIELCSRCCYRFDPRIPIWDELV